MKELIYNNIGAVLQLDKHGELIQKRMKAAKVCEGLFVTAPDRTQFVSLIIEYRGVKWIEHSMPAKRVNIEHLTEWMPKILASIEDGKLAELNDYHKELHRHIFTPKAPAIMELKQPERKKRAPLAEDEKRVNVYMFKGCTDETTEKKITIKEIAPHIYTHVYKLRRYGERVKIIFEIDGVYFQGADYGAFIMEREDFIEISRNAYDHARENIVDGAAKDMAYFLELAKRLNLEITTEAKQAAELRRADIEAKRAEAEKWRETVAIREQQRKEAEARRKAELLAGGKEKLMANKAVTVEQIELLAESVGYTIHGRTLGFMREKVNEAVLNTNGTVTVWGRKLTQRNISGTADVLHSIAERLKAQAEEEAEEVQQPATPSETPQISTESAQTKEVSAEEEKRGETPTEPPQDTQTDGREEIPPKPKEVVRSVPATPPGNISNSPPNRIIILSGPPGQLLIITLTINKNLIIQNHDRNNCLAHYYLHNRRLRLSRLPVGSGYNLRHLHMWHPPIMVICKTYRQVRKKESRVSPHRSREGNRRVGKEMGKKASHTQIIISHKQP